MNTDPRTEEREAITDYIRNAAMVLHWKLRGRRATDRDDTASFVLEEMNDMRMAIVRGEHLKEPR